MRHRRLKRQHNVLDQARDRTIHVSSGALAQLDLSSLAMARLEIVLVPSDIKDLLQAAFCKRVFLVLTFSVLLVKKVPGRKEQCAGSGHQQLEDVKWPIQAGSPKKEHLKLLTEIVWDLTAGSAQAL